MSLIVSEVYDALIEAGASEAKAKAAAGAIPLAEHLATKADTAEVRTDLTGVKAELKDDIAGVKAEIAQVRIEVAEVKAELKADIAGVRTELAGAKAELKADISGLEARFTQRLWLMSAIIVGLNVTLKTCE
jgi:hypothetical protein